MNTLRTTQQSVRVAIALMAVAAAAYTPVAAQDSGVLGLYMDDIGTMGDKFVELADAMSADQFAWRPMDGVRSVSEVYMLMAAEYYAIPAAWGADAPEGVQTGQGFFGRMAQVTEKAAVLDHLKKSLAYYKAAVGNLTEADLHRTISFFGRDRPVIGALVIITGDQHEHLGQAIAYARTNHVVPPWTARANQN